MMPARRSVERTESTRSGRFPRFNAVPPPTGATACPRAAASARASAVSCASPGTRTAEAETPSMETVPTSDLRLPTSDSLEGMDAELLSHRLHAQSADLSTHVALREELFRVERPGRIETVLQAGHCREVVGGVDEGHVAALFGSDAMLAREGPADIDAVGDDFFARLEYPLGRAANTAIKENQWVQ